MAAFLLVGSLLFNYGVGLKASAFLYHDSFESPVSKSLKIEEAVKYVVCISLGFFLVVLGLSYFSWKLGLVDLYDAAIFSFMLMMIPMFETLGIVELYYWIVFIMFPSLVAHFIKKRLIK